jgi:hypothetical protein
MRSLRYAASRRLMRLGATLTLDAQEMWRRARASGVRELGSGDAQMFGSMALLSTVAIRLGRWLMPAVPPDLTSTGPAAGNGS